MHIPLLSPQAMHAPDGFFAPWLAILGWLITLATIALAIRNTRQLGEKQVPMMGIMAAAIFAGQMLNFTIPGGTSGHLLGGALAAILLGPWAGVLVMTAVIAVQALLFQDGGLVVMGLNVINMGIVTGFVGYFVYSWLKRALNATKTGNIVAGFVAAWTSVVVTSIAASLELALSGTSPLAIALPAMLGVHVMIGVGEGILTVAALSFITVTRPDLITGEYAPGKRTAGVVLVGLLVALGLTLFAPLASPYSDGLERVAEVLSDPAAIRTEGQQPVGIAIPDQPQFDASRVRDAPFKILPDYTIPGLGDSPVSTILAGVVGVLVMFGIGYGLAVARRGQKGRATKGA
jgi:cobalt/nickel transport system permease protein